MAALITEISHYRNKAKAEGCKLEFSRNQIIKGHGLSPSAMSNRMTRIVQVTHLHSSSVSFLPVKMNSPGKFPIQFCLFVLFVLFLYLLHLLKLKPVHVFPFQVTRLVTSDLESRLENT